tara:strand:+ start:348 stop:761 length:414 start_codon:yes stop_codon:yes gene_type:complete
MNNELYFKKPFTIYIGEWDYEYRNPYADEPSDNIATNYYAQIGDNDGNTWVHYFKLSTENNHREDCKERIQKLIDRIQKHLAQGKPINLDHWAEGHPMYGSIAWQKFDREEIQPAAEMLSRGQCHIEDLLDSVRGYF